MSVPTSDEEAGVRGGRISCFKHGVIYWTAKTGAHWVHGASWPSIRPGAQEVRGAIRDKWAATGWERGPLGYPVADETDNRNRRNIGRHSRFQKGHISWTNVTGANPRPNGTTYEVRLSQFDESFPGSGSPGGCGGTSQYNVHWPITRLS